MLTRSAARAVRNAPITASVALRHLGRDPWKAASVALRAAPTPLRRVAADQAERCGLPVLAPLALAAGGDRAGARSALLTLTEGTDLDVVRHAGAAAAALGLVDVSAAALDRLPEDDPQRARLTALLRHAEGHHRQALDALVGTSDPTTDRLRRRIAGELSALDALGRISRVPPPPPRTPATGGPARPVAGTPSVRRVLHVAYNALPEVQAGYTLRTHGIARAQVQAGLEVTVVTRPGFPVDTGAVAAPREVVLDGVRYIRLLPLRPLPTVAGERLDRYADEVTELARRLDVDVIHAHSRHDNAQAAVVAGRRLGVPVVYEVRGFIEETWRSRGGDPLADEYRLFKRAETACMQAADAVVTLSGTMRDDIVARGVPADHVTVVGNAVGDAFLEPVPDPAALRAGLGIDPGDVVYGVVSTLNDYEGIDVLVAAIARLRALPGHERARLLVVGGGPAEADLRTMAEGGDGSVVMTGRVPHEEVRAYHAAIDVFCVPRRRTTVTALVPPLKPIEALATGRPLVVSDLPPLRELVEACEAGLVAAPDDPDAWVAAMARLYAPPDRSALGARARRWVSEHRTWTAASDRYAQIYRELVADRQQVKE